MAHAIPPLPPCPDKEELIEDIRLAMKIITDLNNREMEAVITGEFARLPQIKAQLVDARKWKDDLLEEYYGHLREHGCEP